MKFVGLVLKSARRSKRRTALTVHQRRDRGVPVRVAARRARRLQRRDRRRARRRGSSRMRSTSLIFSMPTSHADAIRNDAGRAGPDVGELVRRHLQGSEELLRAVRRSSPRATCACIPEIMLTPEERKAFLDDRTGCIVGDGLAKTIRLQGRRQDRRCRSASRPTARQDFDFTVRGVYRSGGAAVDNQSMMFHWKYADERSLAKGQIGWFIAQIANPDQAAQIAQRDRPEVRELAVRDEDRHRAGVSELVRLDVRQPEPAARQHRARGRDHHAVRGRQHDGDVGPRADDGDRGDADARLPDGARSSC